MTFLVPPPEPVVPTLEDIELDLQTLLSDRQHLKQMLEDAVESISDIDIKIASALDSKGVKSVIWNQDEEKKFIVIRRKASEPRAILDRVLLLDAGVTPSQLQAGTKLGKPGKSGITVRGLSQTRPTPYEADEYNAGY